jgi:hypothetical protein
MRAPVAASSSNTNLHAYRQGSSRLPLLGRHLQRLANRLGYTFLVHSYSMRSIIGVQLHVSKYTHCTRSGAAAQG